MARAVVSAVVGPLGPLLEKLNALHAGEYGRMRGVRTLIGSLRSELTSMHATVKDYDPEMLEEQAVEVKTWIALLRELAYDTEYCIDKFIHQLGSDGRHGGFKEFFRKAARNLKTLLSLRGIAGQIDQLKVRINEVKDLKNSSKLDDTLCSTHKAVDPRLVDLLAKDVHLVGLDGPRDDIAKWMLEGNSSSNNCKVLSIIGFGGLGKTALASEIYRKIETHFHFRAFVSVSQKPSIKSIIKDVIYKVPCPDGFIKDIDVWDEMTSIAKLRELLQDKRYLVIVDDIWSRQAWNTIKCAFPENNCSSRIITTTRIVEVALACCVGREDRVYEMKALSDVHSKSLFFKRIFGSEDCPDSLKEVSNKILKKCGGLPLAIVSISGLLANKPAVKEDWEQVKRSIGSAMEKTRSLEGMRSILSLSYNDLSLPLRACLLYLSIFPEDYVIERERLVRLWIAEGLISEENGRSRQEVAENYFYMLINKSMILPVDIGYDGKARACRVHDMILELIISKSTEDNFTTLVSTGLHGLVNRQGFIRRLSVQHIDQELASALANEDLSHVRSLIVTASAGCIKLLPSLVKFGGLHVLDVEDCVGLEDYIMNDIDKLFRLKYLCLSGKSISELPSGTVELGNLETLDLRNTSVQELPDGTFKFTKLEHLHGAGQTKIPNGLGGMRNLRVISSFNVSRSETDAVEELANMINLDELKVYLDSGRSDKCKKHEELLFSLLCKLGTCKLRSLWIHKPGGSLELLDSWSLLPSSLQIFRISGDYCFMNIPKWTAPALTSLAYLEISLTELKEEDLHTLGELASLLYLKLSFVADPVELIEVQASTGFQCLIKFVIYSVAGAHVKFMEGAMPKLEKLNLRLHVSLARHSGFELGFQHLSSLREAVLSFYRVDVTPSEIKAAAAAIRKEACIHPNRPAIDISEEFYGKYNEIGSDEEDLR
ncbi:hypothetical protein CFC21_075010 [Triticum aestivum]|uniref:Uncharacterized protein n=2 Tax=Triticum aestivum TaxID=4565 RepID=A0A3B6LY56_WHEAT|nr:disease resistance protein PIK6-NP-like [Triticum aestivum]KAF7069370.1 hypothetical protein CFC21_075010 [Triticum aestivum]